AVDTTGSIALNATNDLDITSNVDIDLAAAESISIDAATTDHTSTSGVLALAVDTITDDVVGLDIDFQLGDAASSLTGVFASGIDLTVDTDADHSHTAVGQHISITANDASSETIGIEIVAADAGGQVVTTGLLIANEQATDIDLTDGILIEATTDGSLPDALDVSDAEITNALNAGANFMLFDATRQFGSASGVITWEDTSGNDLFTLTDNANVGDAVLSGDLSVNGDDITSDGALSILAATYTRIGNVSTPGDASTDDDLYVSGGLEVDGVTYLDGRLVMDNGGTSITEDYIDVTLSSSTTNLKFLDLDFTAENDAEADVLYGQRMTLRVNDAADTVTGMQILNADNAPAAGGAWNLLSLYNTDSDSSVANGVSIESEAGTLIDAIDASDSDITNALNAGANFVLFDGVREFSNTNGTITWESTFGDDLMTLTADGLNGDLVLTGQFTVRTTEVEGVYSAVGFAAGMVQSGDIRLLRLDLASNGTASTANGSDYIGMEVLTESVTNNTNASAVTHTGLYVNGLTSTVSTSGAGGFNSTMEWDAFSIDMPTTVVEGTDTDVTLVQGIVMTPPTSVTGTPLIYGMTFDSDGAENEWTAELNFEDTSPSIMIGNTGTLTFEDSAGNDLLTLTDNSDVGDAVLSGDLAVNGDDITADGALTLLAGTYVRIGDNNTPTTATDADDFYLSEDFEVDGIGYFDSKLVFDNGGTTATASQVQFTLSTVANGFHALDLDITVDDDAGSDTITAQYLAVTNSAVTADDTVYGLYIDNKSAAAAMDALLYLDNSDSNTSVTDGIRFQDDGGTTVDAIDASDPEITNALNVGANTITGTDALIDFTEFDVSGQGVVSLTPSTTGTFLDFVLETEWTTGDLINIDFASTTTQTGAVTFLDIDLANFRNDNTNTVYGLRIDDFDPTLGLDGTQYGAYIQGTNWDYGLYVEDASRFLGTVTIDGSTAGANLDISDGIITTIETNATAGITDMLYLIHNYGPDVGQDNQGTGVSFWVEDGGDSEEQASIDVVLTTPTNNAENADFRINLMQTGTVGEFARFSGEDDELDVNGTLEVNLVAIGATQYAVCHTNNDNTDEPIGDCDGAPTADYAEQYPVAAGISYGDIVVPGSIKVITQDGQTIVQMVKSSEPYQGPVAGIASDNYGDFTSAGYNVNDSDNPMPIALVGRVPVNVTNENGAIKVGDYLTTSSTPGAAMKATKVGRVIGMALNDFDGTSGQVMVQVNNSWFLGDIIGSDGSSTVITDKAVMAPVGHATADQPSFDSYGFALRGSAWDGVQEKAVEMLLQTRVTDANTYRFSVRDTTDAEVAYITNTGTMQIAGDMVISGKLYPSDRGVAQTNKYIYYDGSEGAGGDFMRTNAKGWSTGSYDFAEMFPSSESLQPGEVVVFAGAHEQVERSKKENATGIAGIVSTRPGFLAGENTPGAFPIALAGRVPTNVTADNGQIKIGDPLMASNKPGYAMKATESGMVVGYALEPLASGDASILVYVNVGYWGGEATVGTPGTNNQASQFASGQNSNYTSLNMSGNIYMSG
ncbi:MAG: hypothetical protein AAB431_02375, partial [Patescibacteria group bacterium]